MASYRFAFVPVSVVGALSALGLVLSAGQAGAATLAADAAAAFDLKVVTPTDLSNTTDVAVLPDGRLVVLQQAGDVLTFAPNAMDPTTDHIDVDNSHEERGLLGVVIDPAFATNQYIYFYASMGKDANNRQKLLRYKLGPDGKLSDQKVLVDMGLMGPANHNGGGIDIYQGNIYMGVGDTGANSTPPTNHFGSCLNHANGKVLRISAADGQPAAGNPLLDVAMATGCQTTGGDFIMTAPDRRIFAWGFRNPFRVFVDKKTGNVWVGDVGESTKEEITVAKLGKHHGYPFQEGTKDWAQAFAPPGECMGITPASECVGPVYDYDHTGGNNCVIGGRILDGCNWPAPWNTRYVFGDYGSGKMWTLDVNGTRDGAMASSVKDFASTGTNSLTSFRMGSDNALYIVEKQRVSRITAKGIAAMPGSCFSATGEMAGGGGAGGGGAGGGGTGGAASGGAAGNGNATGGNNSASGTGNSSAGTGSGTAGSGTSAGTGGSAAAGSGSTAAGTSSTNPGSGGSGTGSSDGGGCGCQVVGGGTASGLGLGGLGLALSVALRRRRARNSRQPKP